MEGTAGDKVASLQRADESSLSSGEQQEKAAAKKSHDAEDDSSDGDSGSEGEHDDDPSSAERSGGISGGSRVKSMDELARMRREKRLAMNRESARVRRKRKKVMMETLQQQVADLTSRNQRYRMANEALTAQVHKLETELAFARSTISMLTNQVQLSRQSLVNPLSLASSGFGFASADPGQSRLQQHLLQSRPEAQPAQLQALASTALGGTSRDRVLLQRSLGTHALSQASRDSLMMSSLGRLPLPPSQSLQLFGANSQNQVCLGSRWHGFQMFFRCCVR